jgi:hypothetical protein
MPMTVEQVIAQIQQSRRMADEAGKRTYDTKSQKNELAVMTAMLNDCSYQVGVYNNSGYQGLYCPAQSFRRLISNSMAAMTGMSRMETDGLVSKYEFGPNDSKEMINFSKEFIHTYLKTGRKLPLGGREASNISLMLKQVPGGTVSYPVKVGEDSQGHAICESKTAYVGAYETVKVYGPCPVWKKEEVKNGNK